MTDCIGAFVCFLHYQKSRQVLHIIGGFSDKSYSQAKTQIDSFNTAGLDFPGTNFNVIYPRGAHSAVNLPGNAILISGGHNGTQNLGSAEVIFEFYNPQDQKVYIDRGEVGSMSDPRSEHKAVLLESETVLTVGGIGVSGTATLKGEFFNPL